LPDTYGTTLEVTVRAIADEIAAAADLVKGKLDGVPAVLVSGLGPYVSAEDGPGAAAILRGRGRSWWQDWFRYGHVEAVRAALQAGESELSPTPSESLPAPSVMPETVASRADRALVLALAAHPNQVSGLVTDTDGEVAIELTGGSAYGMGAAVA